MTAKGDPEVHGVVGQQPDRFELMVIQKVGFVDDQHGVERRAHRAQSQRRKTTPVRRNR